MATRLDQSLRVGGVDFPPNAPLPPHIAEKLHAQDFYHYEKVLQPNLRPRDPAQGINDAPPNFGRDPIPHVMTYSGLVTSLSKAYRYSDEALRHSLENAHAMLNDPVIAGPLFARQMMTALLNWSVVSEDDKDPELKRIGHLASRSTAAVCWRPFGTGGMESCSPTSDTSTGTGTSIG
jgi:hypothetical protein